jgi:hypothetical protein
MSSGGWIGVDLDGTLAQYDGWKGHEHIGEPVPAMLERVKGWIGEGREVRIFTARVWPITAVAWPDQPVPVPDGERGAQAFAALCAISAWLKTHVGQALPVTCVKDYGLVELYDDRAVQVRPNTGELDGESTRGLS